MPARSTKSKHFVTAKVELLGNNDNNDDGTLTSDVELFFKGIDYCSHYYKSSKNGQSNRFERRDFDETTVNYVMAPSLKPYYYTIL